MTDSKSIGKITATEKNPTSCTELRFWVHRDVVIRPFDIVRVNHIGRGSSRSHTYALVQELLYKTDSAGDLANYVSSDFGELNAQPQNERLGTTVAEAEVLYNDQDIEMPVRDGALVDWADADGIREALGLKALRRPIPAGYLQMSNGEEIPVEFEADYLIGPEGAHLNIAGISGLATKTSYAMFLLNSLQQRLSKNVSIVVFNVKGTDLLALDEPNQNLGDRDRSGWRKCGLEPSPFQNVTYLYPFRNDDACGFTCSHIDRERHERQRNAGTAFNYYYDVEAAKRKLAFLFSDIDDPNGTMESIAHQLHESQAESWDSLRREVRDRTDKGKPGDIPVVSWRKFNRLLRTRTEHDLFSEKAATKADAKRQRATADAMRRLQPGQVLVIDLEPLPDYLQAFVFGDVIQTILGIKLGDEEDTDPRKLGTVVVFADELNKYAPRTSRGNDKTLTQGLLEVTERGRSLGLVLFGAEQFRSGVHDRVLGNCSTNVFGRTSPVEIAKCPDYSHFPATQKSALSRLSQGELLLQHAVFKTSLIKVRFPRSSYHQPRV